MKRMSILFVAIIAALLSPVSARAQGLGLGALQGFCDQGGKHALTAALPSTNYLQGIIPSCQVQVFLSGTTTPAPIFSDAAGHVLANPFTANDAHAAAPGQWTFWADPTKPVDVVLSGGIAPNVYSTPVTLTDKSPSSAGAFVPLAGGTMYGALFAPNINGEVYPAACGRSPAPSWCSGSTASDWMTAACNQLPAKGGVVNLLGLTGNWTSTVACTSPTKQVIFLEDPTSPLSITENDGGTPLVLDNGSMFLGPGAGQCPNAGGIHLVSPANVTAIVGPAHTDGTQEDFTATGLCLWGNVGTTVSKGLIYAKSVFVNTTISNNNLQEANGSAIWLENVGGMVEVYNNEINVTDGVYSIVGSGIVVASTGGPGCGAQSINIHGGNVEHANGAGQNEIEVIGSGSGSVACGLYVHDIYVEKNIQGTPSTTAIKIQDCFACSFKNIEGGGGTPNIGDMINLSASNANSVENVQFSNISNVFGSWTNTINDTTSLGTVIPFSSYPLVDSYTSNPGYQQPPVLPGSTIQSVGSDIMGGLGGFSTGDANRGTGFVNTGCNGSINCTYTRTNTAPPPGYTFSQQVQITANGDASSGFNGVQYGTSTPVSFIAGQQYVASFWGKGDGSFGGFPTFLLWNSLVPTFYCFGTSPTPFTTSWVLYSFGCTPTVSGSSNLAIAARTPIGGTPGSTGTFSLGGFVFNPVQPMIPGALLSAQSPYGIGAAQSNSLTTSGSSGPATLINGILNIPQYAGGSGAGVSSINTVAGAYTFSFSAGAGNCTGTTCTFTGSGSGGGSVTNFIANTGDWPSWLTPTVTNSTTTPTLAVAASAIPNSALANPGLTLGSTGLTLGGTTTTIAGLTLTSPTLTAPVLGTPVSANLANATNLPWTAITGTPSTSQVPVQSLSTTGTSGPATLIAGTLNIPQYTGGTGGGGTVASCSLANQLSAYLTAGSTVNCQPGLFSATPTMTAAQLTTLFSSVASAGGSAIIPNGTAQVGFNPSTALGGQDWRQGAALMQLGALGIAYDAKQFGVTLSTSTNLVNVGSSLSAADVGESMWVSSGGLYTATQQTWMATITAYTFPNATLSANPPFNFSGNVYVGTDNTARFQAALNAVGRAIPLLIPTASGLGNPKPVGIMTCALTLNNSQSIIGMGSGNQGSKIIGCPGQDIFVGPDTASGLPSDSDAGMRIEHAHLVPDQGVNWAWGYTSYNAFGVPTTVPPVYRPLFTNTYKANNPCGPGWAKNCFIGIASTTQNSGAICVLTPGGATVSNQIVFPDMPTAFVATVSSVGSSCGSGGTTYNISPSFPNVAGYTVAQAEFMSTSSVQTSNTAITGTYPQVIHLANSIAPDPAFRSNVAASGRIKDSAGQSFMYFGSSFAAGTITLTAGPSSCTGVDCSTGFAIVPRNPCTADFNTPYPYTPTLNSGDSTPSGANYFPGDCAGAAGLAYPTANGNVFVGTGPSQARIIDVDVAGSRGTNDHGVACFYFAGNKTGYDTLFDSLRCDNAEFSFVQGPASYGQHGVLAVGPTSNGNQLSNSHFFSPKGPAFVNWQGSPISQVDVYSSEINPYDGTTNGASATFYMSPTLDEQTGGIVTSVTTDPVSGVTIEPENGTHSKVDPFVDIACFTCDFRKNAFEGGFSIADGIQNSFESTQLGLPVIDYGKQNTFDRVTSLSGRIGLTWPSNWLNWGNEGACNGFTSGSTGPLGACGAGYSQPYSGKSAESDIRGVTVNQSTNDLGGQIKPGQWNTSSSLDASPMTSANNVDATETYWGRNATCALGGAATCSLLHFPSDFLYISPFNPIAPTSYIYNAEFKSSNGSLTSFTLTIGAVDSGDSACTSPGTIYTKSITLTTSYAPVSDRVDFSGHPGCVLRVAYGTGNAAGNLTVGYFNFLQASNLSRLPTGTLTTSAACPAGSVAGDLLSDDGTSIYWCGPSNTIIASGSGGGGSLPSAPGYGYAPISTGAGTTYSAQITPLSFGSNGVQYIQQPLGSGFFPTFAVNSFGNVFYADGFSSYGGVGQAVVAWASGPNYKQCQVVSNSGLFYINLNNGTSGSVTPGTNTGVWYPVPNNLPATAPDCAFYTADSYTRSQNKGSLVQFGNGTYTANQGWVEQTTGSSFGDEFGVSLSGAGQGVTYLAYAGTAGIPFISRPNGAANFASIHIYDMTIDAGGLASSVWDLDTLNQSYFFNLSIGHVAPGSDHEALFAHTGGFGFQVFAKNINVGVFPDQNFPNCAQVTASGTTTIAFTVVNGGSCYAAPSSSRVAHVQLRGTQAGTAAFPCTVMPTGGGVPTFTGSALTSITSMTGGTGCVGPYYVQVYESVPVNYGIVFNNSDSSAEDITSYVGDTAAFSVNAGNFVGTHLHPSVVPNGIIWNASGALVGTEIDDVFDKAFTINQPFTTTGASITGTNGYVGCGGTSRINAGATMYYFAATTTNVNIGDSASLFDGGGTNSTCNAGWTPFLTQSGPITSPADLLAKAPTGFSETGQDKSITQTASIGDYIPTLTVNSFLGNTVKGNTVNGATLGTATSGTNFGSAGSPGFGPCGSYWNGSGAISICAIEQINVAAGTNPAVNTTFAMFPCPTASTNCTWIYQNPVVYTLTSNFQGKAQFANSTITNAPMNMGAGVAPTSPVNGDVWTTSAGMFAQIAGSTIGPFASTGVVAGVSSFNTRTGSVVPVSGDYTIAQVTGGAPLASPTLTGTPAAPTAAFGTNTTQLATTAFVQASIPSSSETVSSSTTPTLSVTKLTSYMVLTGNVTTFTLASGTDGQYKTICWGQGAGSFTVAPPANVHGFAPVGLTASLFSCQDFVYNGANTIWLARSAGVVNE